MTTSSESIINPGHKIICIHTEGFFIIIIDNSCSNPKFYIWKQKEVVKDNNQTLGFLFECAVIK